jgi:hypothetical protein
MLPACQIRAKSSRFVNHVTAFDGRIVRVRRSLALVVLVCAVGIPGCARSEAGAEDCREQFAEQARTMSGYGNPGTSALPTLTARWDSLHAAFERLGRTARSIDCADLDRLGRTVESVEHVLVTADDHVMTDRLSRVEKDLATAQDAGELDPLPAEVAEQLEVLRVAAPVVTIELAPQLDAVDRADPLDADAVDAAQDALRTAAEASDQHDDCLEALKILDTYGLGDYEATLDAS